MTIRYLVFVIIAFAFAFCACEKIEVDLKEYDLTEPYVPRVEPESPPGGTQADKPAAENAAPAAVKKDEAKQEAEAPAPEALPQAESAPPKND